MTPQAPEVASAVVDRALAGDEEAFAEIVRHYRGRLFRTARLLLGSSADAEEVVQNVFVRFFRYGGGYDRARPLSAYLHRIGVLEAYRRLGERKRREEPSLGDLRGAGWYLAPPPETDRLEAAERLAAVREALELLTDRERVCFVLREVEHRETADIAESLGLSPVTVRRFCSIARSKIALALAARFGPGRGGGGEGA